MCFFCYTQKHISMEDEFEFSDERCCICLHKRDSDSDMYIRRQSCSRCNHFFAHDSCIMCMVDAATRIDPSARVDVTSQFCGDETQAVEIDCPNCREALIVLLGKYHYNETRTRNNATTSIWKYLLFVVTGIVWACEDAGLFLCFLATTIMRLTQLGNPIWIRMTFVCIPFAWQTGVHRISDGRRRRLSSKTLSDIVDVVRYSDTRFRFANIKSMQAFLSVVEANMFLIIASLLVGSYFYVIT